MGFEIINIEFDFKNLVFFPVDYQNRSVQEMVGDILKHLLE